MKFLCDQCKAKYQIADEKAAGKTVRMKCRKCGHLIEVRAAVTESSSAGPHPDAAATAAAPRSPQKPAPPRASPLATSLASAKPPAKPGQSALAGAFKSSVQREEETSAPFDMADLSPNDEWYVAINGVPVGPIRVAEVRRKAALGAVTEESLCWQEGLDEWRPVRSFSELALIVREAAASGRSSLPPAQAEGRASLAPSQRPPPARPVATPPPRAAAAVVARPVATPPPAAARSNVVPFMSRLATAERLEEDPDDRTRPVTSPLAEPAVIADPFANPPGPPAAMAAPMATQHVSAISEAAAAAAIAEPPAERKAPPWMAIAMVAAAAAFGVTAAIAVFFRPAAPPTTVVAQTPGSTAPTASAAPAAAAPTATSTDPTSPEPSAIAAGPKPAGGSGPGRASPSPTASAVAAKGPIDLGGLGGSVRPTDDPGGDSPKAPGQCFSSGQVSQVIGLHQPGIRRSCWERNPTTKPTVNVNVSLTIGSDGSPQGVSASADEPSVAKCVENDVRTWRFPSMGCSQQTSFSFHFVRQ